MDLAHTLRLDDIGHHVVSMVGAGGKTTSLFQLARTLIGRPSPLVIVTATSHLATGQLSLADRYICLQATTDLQKIIDQEQGIVLFTGETREDRTQPISKQHLSWLRESLRARGIPLLIEADGSRTHPLKAPAEHEPPIPEFSDTVVVIAGLSALGKPLTAEHVHRAEIYSDLAGVSPGDTITADGLLHVLAHPNGGLKNIPRNARRVVFLNQADTPALKSIAGTMAHKLLDHFDAVIVGSLKHGHLETVEKTAGIILAAGGSTRFGAPKQLLDWRGKPFIRQVAETALRAQLNPVIVVASAHADRIEAAVKDLPVKLVHNPDHMQGQSTSIKTGLGSLASNVGACVFLLADQPQIPVEVILALKERHYRELPAILAPLVLEERRANPVLFDRRTFPDLMQLSGDVGGRAIFDRHKVEYLPWHDDILLFDVDKPEDYQRLKDME
jgi:molybdenum cofactor cytidylyltransferase